MRVFFSVGEPSGDLHGANLIRDLRRFAPGIEACGFGGPKMAAAGCRTLFDLTSLAVMFFADALKHYRTFRKHLAAAEEFLDRNPVEAVVLIDFPGFNWHVARLAKKRGIPVFYFGLPQMWAWAPWRTGKLRRLVDHALCKLPFEPAWFAARGVNAVSVGHPWFDEIDRQEAGLDQDFVRRMTNPASPAEASGRASARRVGDVVQRKEDPASPLLLLLPGSRDSEVKRNWPVLRDTARRLQQERPGLRVAVGCFSDSHRRRIEEDLRSDPVAVDVFSGRTPELIRSATCAIACSGSVSLELLAARLPSVIVYRLSRFNHFLATWFVRCRYITLVNLLAAGRIERDGRALFDPASPAAEEVPMPEYLDSRDRSADVAAEVGRWLDDPPALARNRQWLDRLASEFARPGASVRAAEYIAERLDVSQKKAPRRQAA